MRQWNCMFQLHSILLNKRKQAWDGETVCFNYTAESVLFWFKTINTKWIWEIRLESISCEKQAPYYKFSQFTNAVAIYSTSTLNLATAFCFLLFKDIKLPPVSTQYLEMDCLSMGRICVTTTWVCPFSSQISRFSISHHLNGSDKGSLRTSLLVTAKKV
jgi:hypothetical protein